MSPLEIMSKTWIITGLVLQFFLLLSFYRLFYEERMCVVHEGTALPRNWLAAGAFSKNYVINWKQLKKAGNLTAEVNWDAIPRKPAPPVEELHDKWIIVTTINSPTEDVKKLALIKGWKVVVVGDTKTPANWSHPNCVFLSTDKQKTLGYRITNLLPYRSYARKNIGYLYAIQHGAKIIYDTDDDNSPTSGEITFHQQQTGDFFVYKTDQSVVNPYEHFGQSTMWPRGYPLDYIGDPPSHKFVKCKDAEPSIQQGVVNGDPDVDAIFRLTRKDKDVPLNIEFDSEAPAVLLPAKTLAPFNSQNTLFLYKALWAMLLPSSVTFRTCDIWRGYWAQRLLWDTGAHLAFFPPNARQFRNAHNYLFDFIDEKALYHDSGRLVNLLVNWKSEKRDFFSRVMDLSIEMAHQNFWGIHDVMLTEAWLTDLISVGYKMPDLNPIQKPCKKVISEVTEILPREKPAVYLRAGTDLKTFDNNKNKDG